MIRTGLGIKLLGLCGLVFALMAIVASGAQAAASWLVLTSTGTVVEEGTVSLEKETTIIFHTKIAGLAVLFECEAVQAEGFQLKAAGTIGAGAKVKYSKCITKLNNVTNAPCLPTDPVGGAGTIVTKPLHGALVLHELESGAKDELLLLLPDSGEIFVTISTGAECAIGTKVNIIGTHLMLKDCQNELLVHKKIHLVEEGPLTELWAISRTEEHKANILGSAFAIVDQGGGSRAYAGHAG